MISKDHISNSRNPVNESSKVTFETQMTLPKGYHPGCASNLPKREDNQGIIVNEAKQRKQC
jgi:hypothetical protein